MSTRTETLRIEGMTCGHCVRAVREALEAAPGVAVEVVEIGRADFGELSRAVVRYDDEQARRADLAARVEDAGYTVAGVEAA